MIEAHAKKRGRSFLLWIVCSMAFFGFSSKPFLDYVPVPSVWGVVARGLSLGLVAFFWFKAMYHWAKAKGYSGWMSSLGVLGLPVAPIVFACVKDLTYTPPPIIDPIRNCPHCSKPYRLGDYNPAAVHISCSYCKGELRRT